MTTSRRCIPAGPMPGAYEIAALVREGTRSAESVVTEALERIDRTNAELNAFREVDAEAALARARDLDRRVAQGEDPGPLAGVPVGIKDNIVTATGTTTCGSRMLDGYRSPFTATAVERLEAAGAIPIGKLNCDEFAMGSSTEHCAWGPVRNPWDTRCVPGGSSGGSAAAVAAGLCPVTLGSDTGGSIRQPAALCGCVGVKPTYGRVSRWGLVAFGSSLDQIGPFAANVRDAALLTDLICGFDPRDSTSADVPSPACVDALNLPSQGLRLGLPRGILDGRNHPAVDAALHRAIDLMREAGATIVDIDLPLTDEGIATYYILAPAEASSNLARFDGIRYGHRAEARPGDDLEDLYARSRSEGFGAEVQRRIMLGTYVLSSGYYDAYYRRALQVRRLIKEEYDAAFAQCDGIIGPTTSGPAFRLGEKSDPVSMYLCDVYTTNVNIAGICAMSLPMGRSPADDDGGDLPLGLHIQCPAFAEETMFRIAGAWERMNSA